MAYVSFFWCVCVYPVFSSHNLIDWISTTFAKKLFSLKSFFSSSQSSLMFLFLFSFFIIFSLFIVSCTTRESGLSLIFFLLLLFRALAMYCNVYVRVCVSFCSLYSQRNATLNTDPITIILCHCVFFALRSHSLYNDLIGWLKLAPHSNEVSIAADGWTKSASLLLLLLFSFLFFSFYICKYANWIAIRAVTYNSKFLSTVDQIKRRLKKKTKAKTHEMLEKQQQKQKNNMEK